MGLVLALLQAGPALAGDVTVRFTHDQPAAIVEFRALFGLQAGVYTQALSLGLPTPSSGVYEATIDLPEGVDIYVVLTAVDSQGLESAPSNERVRFIPTSGLGAPGRPLIVFQ